MGRDTDRYGRMVAVCWTVKTDLSQWMVRQGQAIAYRKYSLDYVADEANAKAAKIGISAGNFQAPTFAVRFRVSRAIKRNEAAIGPKIPIASAAGVGDRSAYLRAGGSTPTCGSPR